MVFWQNTTIALMVLGKTQQNFCSAFKKLNDFFHSILAKLNNSFLWYFTKTQ
jgi:hypothetical protein